MIARRIDRDRQIFDAHREPQELEPFNYRNNSQALADVAVTGLLRYMALAGRGVPLHWGMRVFSDEDAPWALIGS